MTADIIRSEGVSSLFKGYQCAYYGGMIYGAAYFTAYKQLKTYFMPIFEERSKFLTYFVSSILAEAVGCCFFYPTELAKVRAQTGYGGKYNSFGH